jgi:hypothetical protein
MKKNKFNVFKTGSEKLDFLFQVVDAGKFLWFGTTSCQFSLAIPARNVMIFKIFSTKMVVCSQNTGKLCKQFSHSIDF